MRAPIAPEQIHIAYTSAGGSALSVDFVGGAAAGAVHWGASPSALTHTANSSSFEFATIGWLHQALMDFAGVVPAGSRGYYAVEVAGNASAVFEVMPLVANRSERHVVFGDFGLRNDVSMGALIADAAAGAFDSVLHVGDWACESRKQPPLKRARAQTCSASLTVPRLAPLPVPPVEKTTSRTITIAASSAASAISSWTRSRAVGACP